MDYSNPEIPEGINTSKQHPLKDFFILLVGVLGCIVLCVFILSLFAERLALYIPFSMEQKLMGSVELEETSESSIPEQEYINSITSKLLQHMDMPEDISVDVHYIDEGIENAFANLGGQIYIYRGLIDLLPNENALAMVIAHEIAHIKHRDPIVALGRGVVVGLFLTAILGSNSDRLVSNLISDTGTLTVMGFNRDQEKRADELALATIASHYGHVQGADELFKAFISLEEEYGSNLPEFFSTHPLSEKRISNIKHLASENKWLTEGKVKPLPSIIKSPKQP